MADLVVIKKFLYRHEAAVAKGLLDEAHIESIVSADDCVGWPLHLSFTSGGIRLLVQKKILKRQTTFLKFWKMRWKNR